MTKNIEININTDGTNYEVLYPKVSLSNSTGTIDISTQTSGNLPLSRTSGTLSLNSTSGILSLSRGGTGQTSAAKSLWALINGSSDLTANTLAIEDYVAIGDVSASTGKRIKVTELAETINILAGSSGGGIETDVISWTGTGSTSSSANKRIFATKNGYSIFAIFVVQMRDAGDFGVAFSPILFNGSTGYVSVITMQEISSRLETTTKGVTCSLSGTTVTFPTSVSLNPPFNGNTDYWAMALYKAN